MESFVMTVIVDPLNSIWLIIAFFVDMHLIDYIHFLFGMAEKDHPRKKTILAMPIRHGRKKTLPIHEKRRFLPCRFGMGVPCRFGMAEKRRVPSTKKDDSCHADSAWECHADSAWQKKDASHPRKKTILAMPIRHGSAMPIRHGRKKTRPIHEKRRFLPCRFGMGVPCRFGMAEKRRVPSTKKTILPMPIRHGSAMPILHGRKKTRPIHEKDD